MSIVWNCFYKESVPNLLYISMFVLLKMFAQLNERRIQLV